TLSWPAVATATGYDVFFNAGAGPAVTQVATNLAGTTFNAGVLATGNYSWRVIPRNANGPATGCGDFTFTVVSNPAAGVAPTSSITVVPASATVCSGTVAITTTITNGATSPTYAWTPSTGVSSTSVSNPVITPPAGTTIYTVTVTTTGSCSTTGTVSLTNAGT